MAQAPEAAPTALPPAPRPRPSARPQRARILWAAAIVAVALAAGGIALARRSGPTSQSPASTTPPATPQVDPGRLSVNAAPWGDVFLDGRPVGQTPLVDLSLPPGRHRLRVARSGFEPYEQTIEIASGQRVVMTDLVLKPLREP